VVKAYQLKIDIRIAVNHNTFLLFRSTHVTCFGRSENLQALKQPYPPRLNKAPATPRELGTGASTWALGSHKGTKNIDILTRKVKIVQIYNNPSTNILVQFVRCLKFNTSAFRVEF
jgi:hypothetical protein